MTALLQTQGLTAFYGDAQALFGIDFQVDQGEMVAIIGANGAGKSTFMKAVTGLVKVQPSHILWQGRAIGGLPAYEIVKRGIALVPEGRRLFPSLSVEENLLNAQVFGMCRACISFFPYSKKHVCKPPHRCPAVNSKWWRLAGP